MHALDGSILPASLTHLKANLASISGTTRANFRYPHIDASLVQPFSPPASDYDSVSEDRDKAEYRCFNAGNGSFGGYWKGSLGSVSFESWPYGELCAIVSGRVAVEDLDSARREFGAGDRAGSMIGRTSPPASTVGLSVIG
jgi:uncharacterized cupin superfamily protein